MTPSLYVIALLLCIIVICLFLIAGLMDKNKKMRQIIVRDGLHSEFRLTGIRS